MRHRLSLRPRVLPRPPKPSVLYYEVIDPKGIKRTGSDITRAGIFHEIRYWTCLDYDMGLKGTCGECSSEFRGKGWTPNLTIQGMTRYGRALCSVECMIRAMGRWFEEDIADWHRTGDPS